MPSTPIQMTGLLYYGGKRLRELGRDAAELRPVEITPNFISSAEGSALIRFGETRVITTASVEDGVPPFLKGSGRGWITGEYSMLPRSTGTRTPREVTKGRQSGRTLEIQRLIGRTLRAVTDLPALGERTVWIDCDVIRADGGTRTASVTGAFVALGLAMLKLRELKVISRMPLLDYLAAVSAGIVDGEVLLDLDYGEDSHADVDLNAAMTGNGRLVEVQAAAEGRPYAPEELTQLLDVARSGVQKLVEIQRSILEIDFPAAATAI